jgi:hypothetical protein
MAGIAAVKKIFFVAVRLFQLCRSCCPSFSVIRCSSFNLPDCTSAAVSVCLYTAQDVFHACLQQE